MRKISVCDRSNPTSCTSPTGTTTNPSKITSLLLHFANAKDLGSAGACRRKTTGDSPRGKAVSTLAPGSLLLKSNWISDSCTGTRESILLGAASPIPFTFKPPCHISAEPSTCQDAVDSAFLLVSISNCAKLLRP